MVVKHLFHSSVTVETDQAFFIFDYIQDDCPKVNKDECGYLSAEKMPKDKPIYVFVSHTHYDHFDVRIFSFKEGPNPIHYIAFEDEKIKQYDEQIHYVKPGDYLEFADCSIDVFGSTDEGVCFYVETDRETIFHAGDLNWWHWEGESIEEREFASDLFHKEMQNIGQLAIDIAFFPVDPRLESAYDKGPAFFIDQMNPTYFIPIHFQDSFSVTKRFKEEYQGKFPKTEILKVEKRNQKFLIETLKHG